MVDKHSNLALALFLVRIHDSYYNQKLKKLSSGVQYYMLSFTLANIIGTILHHFTEKDAEKLGMARNCTFK